MTRIRHGALLVGLIGCAEIPAHPQFTGQATESWIAFDVGPVGRGPDDLLPSFQASARAFGCRTQQLSTSLGLAGRGAAKLIHGIAAYCEDGALAIIPLEGTRVRVGCQKPTTRARCEDLLRRIADER